jgi:hypothetical protein
MASRKADPADPALCFLCGRPLGAKVEWHHPVPKSRGGRETAPVHPICHRAIHAALTNKELERGYATAGALRSHPELAKFVAWVTAKHPDFHAPTRRKKT